MQTLVIVTTFLVAFKAMTIGSEFSFIHWFKYGREYTGWYFNRPEFKPRS